MTKSLRFENVEMSVDQLQRKLQMGDGRNVSCPCFEKREDTADNKKMKAQMQKQYASVCL